VYVCKIETSYHKPLSPEDYSKRIEVLLPSFANESYDHEHRNVENDFYYIYRYQRLDNNLAPSQTYLEESNAMAWHNKYLQ